MIWLTWRQFRLSAAVAAVGLAALAVIVVITGRQMVHLYDTNGIAACTAAGDPCGARIDELLNRYAPGRQLLVFLMLAAPGLIGIFWGATLVAHEFEAGTYRLAWTQSVSRTRWLATKVAVAGVASMAVAGLLSFMVSWWFRPIDWTNADRFSPGTFDSRGVVALGYAAFALALGVTAGLLMRRTLPAMTATLAAFAGVRFAFDVWARPHLWSPAHLSVPLQADAIGFRMTPSGVTVENGGYPNIPALSNAWVYSRQIVDSTGHAPTQATMHEFLQSACPDIAAGPAATGKGIRAADRGSFDACVSQLSTRFHHLITYQPASRYWPFQWSETAIFIALALILCGFCFWWIRRDLG